MEKTGAFSANQCQHCGSHITVAYHKGQLFCKDCKKITK